MSKTFTFVLLCAGCLYGEKPKEQKATEAIQQLRDAEALLGNEQLNFVASMTDEQKKIQTRLDSAAKAVSARQKRAEEACKELGKTLGQEDRSGDGLAYKVPACVDSKPDKK